MIPQGPRTVAGGALSAPPVRPGDPKNRDEFEQKTKITKTATGDTKPGHLPGEV